MRPAKKKPRTLDMRTFKRIGALAESMDSVRRELQPDDGTVPMKETAPGVFEPSTLRERLRKNMGHALAGVFQGLAQADAKRAALAAPIVPEARARKRSAGNAEALEQRLARRAREADIVDSMLRGATRDARRDKKRKKR